MEYMELAHSLIIGFLRVPGVSKGGNWGTLGKIRRITTRDP